MKDEQLIQEKYRYFNFFHCFWTPRSIKRWPVFMSWCNKASLLTATFVKGQQKAEFNSLWYKDWSGGKKNIKYTADAGLKFIDLQPQRTDLFTYGPNIDSSVNCTYFWQVMNTKNKYMGVQL